mgnify:CR=1 FL=1
MVDRPTVFRMADLKRYPEASRIHFVECSGNGGGAYNPERMRTEMSPQSLDGLLSNSEWTGVMLSTILQEVGVQPGASWVLAEGRDAAMLSRSIPLAKAMDDAMLAYGQNGEAIRPEQGYPLRLALPGWEGNAQVKWLRRLEVSDRPTMTREETSKYTDLLPGGKAAQFTLEMGVKSVITRPSVGMAMQGPGLYEISGIAWSGSGRITRVDISADGGKTWAPSALQEPTLSKSLTRFRIPLQWKGAEPVHLQSRATDDNGNTQPTRDEWQSGYGPGAYYHYNAIQAWKVEPDGRVRNTYE